MKEIERSLTNRYVDSLNAYSGSFETSSRRLGNLKRNFVDFSLFLSLLLCVKDKRATRVKITPVHQCAWMSLNDCWISRMVHQRIPKTANGPLYLDT